MYFMAGNRVFHIYQLNGGAGNCKRENGKEKTENEAEARKMDIK